MASLLVTVGSESGICCFFFTLIKSRDALQWKKHDEKQSLHELKAEMERRGAGGLQANKHTTTDEQLHKALY